MNKYLNQRGASIVEYILLLLIISTFSLIFVDVFAPQVGGGMVKMSSVMNNDYGEGGGSSGSSTDRPGPVLRSNSDNSGQSQRNHDTTHNHNDD